MEIFLSLASKFFLAFTSLLIIVDPIAIVPTLLGLTRNYSEEEFEKVVRRACLIGAEVLIFFQLFGVLLFSLLRIDLNAFKVAGGVLLFLTALDMLKAKNADQKYPSEVDDAQEREDISVFPLAMPLLAGPGAITSVMVYSNDPTSSFFENTGIALVSIGLTFILSYYCLKYSSKIKTMLGQSGISVLQRVMGILLAAISLQLMTEGLTLLVKKILAD